MLSHLLRHLRLGRDVATKHRLLIGQSFQTSAVSNAQIDLYHDLTPFDGGVPQEVISFPPPRQKEYKDDLISFPPILCPTRKRLNQSNISKSFFLVDKKPGELIDQIALYLSKTFSAKGFYIASCGNLDVLASGLILFTCGKSLNYLDAFDNLPHTYRGILKLGQTSQSYDLKTPVDQFSPWKHLTEAQLQKTAKEFVGDILLPPAPIHALRSRLPVAYYVLKNTEDMSEKPVTVYAFDIQCTSTKSPDIPFELVCDSVMEPVSLIHAFGKRLGCRALLYDLQKVAIGEFTTQEAWSFPRILKAFDKAAHGTVAYPDNPHQTRLMVDHLRYTERVVGRNWYTEFRPEKKRKLLPYEKRRRRQERLEMERKGLISDKDIMKRRLKKKAVKLVANLNVPAIEKVYERMLEE